MKRARFDGENVKQEVTILRKAESLDRCSARSTQMDVFPYLCQISSFPFDNPLTQHSTERGRRGGRFTHN